jgi:hypothetical protein
MSEVKSDGCYAHKLMTDDKWKKIARFRPNPNPGFSRQVQRMA